jgi:hypothetical protein
MNTLIPDPECECWDYAFSHSSADRLWIAHPKADASTVITHNPHPMWRYLIAGDTQDALLQDIAKLMEGEEGWDTGQVVCREATIGEVLSSWRLVRYNGRNVCVTECADLSPTNSGAWPGGPMAPVRNGYAYMAVSKTTNRPLGRYINGKNGEQTLIPLTEPTINRLIDSVVEFIPAEGADPVTFESLFTDYWIVAENLLGLAMDYPVVVWCQKMLPIFPIMNLNPNHTGDPEEIALAVLDSQSEG